MAGWSANATVAVPRDRTAATNGRMRMWFLERTTQAADLFCIRSRHRTIPCGFRDLFLRAGSLDRRALDFVADQQGIRGLLPADHAPDPRVSAIEVRGARMHDEPLRAATVATRIRNAYTAGHLPRAIATA